MIVTTPPLDILLTPSGGKFKLIWLFSSKELSVARLSSLLCELADPTLDLFTYYLFFASVDLVAEPRRELRCARVDSLFWEVVWRLMRGTVSRVVVELAALALLLVVRPPLSTAFLELEELLPEEGRMWLFFSSFCGFSGLSFVGTWASSCFLEGCAFFFRTSGSGSIGGTCRAWSSSISRP